nr:hypothetical protein [Tanacetum cinerariifolium]
MSLTRIDKTDCYPEEDIHLAKRLLYDNSSPRPPKEIVSDNSNDDIESFSPSPIPVKDSDSHMEEIDLPFTPDDPMPPGIEYDDYDSGRDIPILKNCLTIIPFYSPPMSHTILIFLYLIVLLQNHQMEKSPDLVPHQGLEAFQPSPGHLAASLGCAETKVATWDDLAFKLITLGWNVKR